MGAVFNTLPLSETENLSNISPNRADWLTSHADATGLAVVEVERLWNRFKQLTGSKDQTKLYPDSSTVANELSNDIFVKNFLKHIPRPKSDISSIPFGTFIIVMQWIDSASVQNKLAAIYHYLNNGEPIDSFMISKLLKHVYRDAKEDEIRALSLQFMQQLGGNDQAKVNMSQFIMGVQRAIPPNELDELLKFDIIPVHLLDEASVLPSLQGSATNIRSIDNFGSNDQVSDEQLRQIANQVANKDWSRLAVTLGFLEYDIESYKVTNGNDSAATMLELLRTWREQSGSTATKSRLKRHLNESGFPELTYILN
ncbi:unnamed protein product [Rotaria magnacalcarata]|uniref:Death domain-containing protein n=4 Tax=Rotaria magnacalcarata TaxID=392030 RepID=A0A816DU66_9BILA|nr:unnamed protein product [Rotaria magnacalcarata]CAF1638403.1 unnamed protein product [Rotaria magnacalcarata]CAF2061328.1 unnamed protein product [Rotaria magnacalcarata]CAF2080641.1 unnamed protein product [Rotaria magnacalcarata]CAF3871948.1 unnamed protein product [Rotaria magnacalcarata]